MISFVTLWFTTADTQLIKQFPFGLKFCEFECGMHLRAYHTFIKLNVINRKI